MIHHAPTNSTHRWKTLGFLVPLLFMVFAPQVGYAVKLDNLILCSRIEGVLLDHGKPVVGATIERSISWNMEKNPRSDHTVTDAKGRFTFPEIRGSANFGFLSKYLHVPAIMQELQIQTDKIPINLYVGGRSNYEPNEETGYPTISMQCDMNTLDTSDPNWHEIKCEVKFNRAVRGEQ